ncbi:hypothetical protein F4680DRAFT_433575 [Xylaria scruposa]|nr:hypothetical protein F4680DRAFT_433575 [Xylaria scruposa]
MAYESTSQYPKGSAEYTATYLTTRVLGCSHPVKYHADGTQEHSKYPSRLGFFHVTSQEPRISFLDTRKLCNACLDAVVPDGFHFWSAYSIINGTNATESRAPEPRWLDMASSSDNYPPLVQAGTEGFPHVSLLSGPIPPHLISPPVVLSIPKVTGAKATWEWLQTKKKPFYIDQLHLTKGWSLIVERRAKIDSMIAEQSGTAYCPEAKPKTQDRKQNSAGKNKTSFEEETGSATTTALRTKDKKKPAKSTHSPSLVTIESTGSIAEPNVVLDGLDNLSKLVEVHKRKDHSRKELIFPPLQLSPEDSKNTTTIDSAEQPTKKTSSASKTGKGAKKKKDQITSVSNLGLGDNTLGVIAPLQCMNLEPTTTPKPNLAETAIGIAPPRKPIQFTFTKNWSNHDPIPYDGPNVHLQLADYRRQAQVIDHARDPGSNFSPEKLMGKKQSTRGKVSLSDPSSSDGTPHMTKLPRSAEAGESKIPMKVSSTTKTKTTKSEPTIGDSSKKTKPSTKEFVGNEPVEVKPRKKAGSPGERIGESGPRQKELAKPSKTRTPEHERAVGKPIKNKPLPDLRSEPKPATVTYPTTKIKDSKLRSPMKKSSSGKKFSISFDANVGFDLHLGKSPSKDSKKKPDSHGASGAASGVASFVQSDPLPNSSTALPPTQESMTRPPEEDSTSLSSIQEPPTPLQGEMPSETGISSPHVEDAGAENTLHSPNVEASTTTPPDQKPPQVEGSSGSEFTENPTDSQASIITPIEPPPSQVETSPGDAEIINAGRTQGPGPAVPTPVTGELQGAIPSPGDAQSTNIGHAHSPDGAATMSSVGESQKVDDSHRDTQITNIEHTQKPEAGVTSIGEPLKAVAKAQEKTSKPKPTTFKSPEERLRQAVPYHTEYPKEATAQDAAQPRPSMNIPPERESQQSGHLQSKNIVNFPSGRWGDDEGSGDLKYKSESSAELYGTNNNGESEDDSNDNNSNNGNEDGDSDYEDNNSNQEDRDSEESENDESEDKKDESEDDEKEEGESENDGDNDGDSENEDDSNIEKEDGESGGEDNESGEEDNKSGEEDNESGEEDNESGEEDNDNESGEEDNESGEEDNDNKSGEEDNDNESGEEDNESGEEDNESGEEKDGESEREDRFYSEEEENNDDDGSDGGRDDEDD